MFFRVMTWISTGEKRKYSIVTTVACVPVTKQRPPAKSRHNVREAGIVLFSYSSRLLIIDYPAL